MNQKLHVSKTNFHMKGFALGLALKQRRKATRKLSIYTPRFSTPVPGPRWNATRSPRMEYFENGKQPERLIDSKASKGENVVYVRVPAYANV